MFAAFHVLQAGLSLSLSPDQVVHGQSLRRRQPPCLRMPRLFRCDSGQIGCCSDGQPVPLAKVENPKSHAQKRELPCFCNYLHAPP